MVPCSDGTTVVHNATEALRGQVQPHKSLPQVRQPGSQSKRKNKPVALVNFCIPLR